MFFSLSYANVIFYERHNKNVILSEAATQSKDLASACVITGLTRRFHCAPPTQLPRVRSFFLR
jgi:hypothetical protein